MPLAETEKPPRPTIGERPAASRDGRICRSVTDPETATVPPSLPSIAAETLTTKSPGVPAKSGQVRPTEVTWNGRKLGTPNRPAVSLLVSSVAPKPGLAWKVPSASTANLPTDPATSSLPAATWAVAAPVTVSAGAVPAARGSKVKLVAPTVR